jgi:serine/threonine protein kinase
MLSVQGYIYTKGKLLGNGSYGTVNKVTRTDGVVFAFKHYARDNGQIEMGALREISILKIIKGYKNFGLIQLQDIILQNDIIGIIVPLYELCLFDAIQSNILTTKNKHNIHKKLLRSLYFLHSNNIIHRDIKPENIMLDSNMSPILIDYTLSKIFNTSNTTETHSGDIATISYRAPEIIDNKSYGFPVDLWSLGIVLREMYGKNINCTKINYFLNHNPRIRITAGKALYKFFKQSFNTIIPTSLNVIEVSEDILSICENLDVNSNITCKAAQYYLDKTKCNVHIAVMLACKFYEVQFMDFSWMELDEEYNKEEIYILKKMNYNLNVM